LVGCVQTEPSAGKGLRTHLTQQDVAYLYRTHSTHRTQGPGWESQDATLLDLTQATFLLMMDISVASKLRKSLTLVRVVFMDTLAILELDSGFLHNHCSDPGSDCGSLLGPTPATQWYKVLPCRIRPEEIAVCCGGCIRYQWRYCTRW